MQKKLQVFVSSTYTDPIEERHGVIEAILDAGHIPSGMNYFSVNKKSSSEALFGKIDASDIYIHISGSRYGEKLSASEVNYTQLEYSYAISKNKPIIEIILDSNGIYIGNLNNYAFQCEHIDLYNKFKHSIPAKIAAETLETRIDLITFLYEHGVLDSSLYCVVESSLSWNKPLYKQNVTNFVQVLYQQNYFTFVSLLDYPEVKLKLMQYFEICKNVKLNSMSNTATSKCLLDSPYNPLYDISDIHIYVNEVNNWILHELNENPTDLYQLSSRRFEELIAEILMRKGYEVELTPATRDGGKDIYVARKDDLGSFLYLVECKRYDPTNKVGVRVIRDLYGTLSKEKATYGIVVTTSDFTKPAQEFQQDLKFQMSLKNFNSIQKWLCDVT